MLADTLAAVRKRIAKRPKINDNDTKDMVIASRMRFRCGIHMERQGCEAN